MFSRQILCTCFESSLPHPCNILSHSDFTNGESRVSLHNFSQGMLFTTLDSLAVNWQNNLYNFQYLDQVITWGHQTSFAAGLNVSVIRTGAHHAV